VNLLLHHFHKQNHYDEDDNDDDVVNNNNNNKTHTQTNKIISSYLLVSTASSVGPFFTLTSPVGLLKPQKRKK
jgi:hypothetical protein